MPPRSFGKYEVLARLASGGAASIFLARQPGEAGFHKLVCLKTLLPERASDADFVAMFLDEARLAARLNHPNCVQIYDLGRTRGVYYISMEYIFGETLWSLLTTVTRLKVPLPSAHVASILASACDGLHHAHELKDGGGRPFNLVHRDVSPQNVMVSYEGQTKVVDFGIAKAETGRVPTVAGIVKGKFSYMSPEQITGGQVDRRSDIYSLGIVLFECLASRRLYRGDSPEDIARLILEHRAPRLREVIPDIPPALDEICATALARHPSKRFQTAQEMGEALRNHLDDLRFSDSSMVIGRLMEERFQPIIAERRQVYEQALGGVHDEAHLLKALDARAVRDVDLFPEGASADPDFREESRVVAPGAVRGAPEDRSVMPPAPSARRSGDTPSGPATASESAVTWEVRDPIDAAPPVPQSPPPLARARAAESSERTRIEIEAPIGPSAPRKPAAGGAPPAPTASELEPRDGPALHGVLGLAEREALAAEAKTQFEPESPAEDREPLPSPGRGGRGADARARPKDPRSVVVGPAPSPTRGRGPQVSMHAPEARAEAAREVEPSLAGRSAEAGGPERSPAPRHALVVSDGADLQAGALAMEPPPLEPSGPGSADLALLDDLSRGRTAAAFGDDDLTQVPGRASPRELAPAADGGGPSARALWGMLVLGLAVGLFVGVGIGLALAR
jgi:serine/threonine protein kinase